MNHNINISLLLVLSLFTGATYAAKSLWGDIDDPQATPPQVVAPAAVAVPEVKVEEKTICEVLRAQNTLDPNIMRTPAIQDSLRNNLQLAPASYKGLLANTASINAMYAQYRTQYLKKNCN